jgi:outer membrane murein-binding lipoprotein Lpp
MTKRALAVLGAVLTAGFAIAGCSNNPNPNQPPVPTTAATDSNGNNAKLVIPTDLIGKNAQLADDELRKVGFVNIRYGAQGATAPDPAHLADWNVSAVDPAGGQTAQSNDNIVVTLVKK